MFQNRQKVVVVSGGDERRVIKVQSASGTPDPSRYPIVDTTGVAGRDQSVQIVSGGDPTRFPILRGVSDARATADSVISALTPAAWYRNATGVTASGGFASQWDDYSGNGRHLVQATGTNQPAYAAGVFTFDGADNFMKVTFTFNQPITVVALLSLVSWTVSDRICDGSNASSLILWETTSSPRISLYAGASASAENSGLTIGGWDVVAGFFSGASSYLKINTGSATTGNPGTAASGGFTLGASPTGTSAANVSVKEVVLVNAEVTEPSLTSLITALAAI